MKIKNIFLLAILISVGTLCESYAELPTNKTSGFSGIASCIENNGTWNTSHLCYGNDKNAEAALCKPVSANDSYYKKYYTNSNDKKFTRDGVTKDIPAPINGNIYRCVSMGCKDRINYEVRNGYCQEITGGCTLGFSNGTKLKHVDSAEWFITDGKSLEDNVFIKNVKGDYLDQLSLTTLQTVNGEPVTIPSFAHATEIYFDCDKKYDMSYFASDCEYGYYEGLLIGKDEYGDKLYDKCINTSETTSSETIKTNETSESTETLDTEEKTIQTQDSADQDQDSTDNITDESTDSDSEIPTETTSSSEESTTNLQKEVQEKKTQTEYINNMKKISDAFDKVVQKIKYNCERTQNKTIINGECVERTNKDKKRKA